MPIIHLRTPAQRLHSEIFSPVINEPSNSLVAKQPRGLFLIITSLKVRLCSKALFSRMEVSIPTPFPDIFKTFRLVFLCNADTSRDAPLSVIDDCATRNSLRETLCVSPFANDDAPPTPRLFQSMKRISRDLVYQDKYHEVLPVLCHVLKVTYYSLQVFPLFF